MKETNHELKEIIRRSGVPIYLLAISMKVPEALARAYLYRDLDDEETYAILGKLLEARKSMKYLQVTPWSREDYDI